MEIGSSSSSSSRRGNRRRNRRAEHRFKSGEVMRDVIMGLSDGLTVPFALAAGLSSTSSALVVTAGLAEVAAGAIAMGLGGYLAAKSDVDLYAREKRREELEVKNVPEDEAEEVVDILSKFGLQPSESKPLVDALRERPNELVDFMMRFDLGLEKPDPRRALRSGITIASSYIIGGLVPLLPYMAFEDMETSFVISVGVTLIALFAFGYIKGVVNGTKPIVSAIQTTIVGALASSIAFAIAKILQAH